jgi:2-C-methyl-D-erythritol 4-phosphate cytidylyltransferase
MKNVAVVLAGGTGSRMYNKADRSVGSCSVLLPKQFMQLAGRAVIEYSIDTFNSHPAIDEVAVVVHPDWHQELDAIVARNRWDKLTRVIDGGSERYMSTLNAVMAYIDYPDDTNLLLHDAARPLVSEAVINRVVAALQHNEAVGVAVPSTDTVWEVHPDLNGALENAQMTMPRLVARIPERRLMWRAQTPQAFRLPLLRDAYQRALQDPQFSATDDCGVVRRYMSGVKIAVVEGEEKNMKLTKAEDLASIASFLTV